MAIEILVVGDLHLGRSSGGIHGNPEESSTRYTLNRIVDWCIENNVDLLFLTGDIIDRNNRYLRPLDRRRQENFQVSLKNLLVMSIILL